MIDLGALTSVAMDTIHFCDNEMFTTALVPGV